MDSLTRVRNAIERKAIDRIPIFDAAWEDTLSAWQKEGFPADTYPGDFFDWDIVTLSVDTSMGLEQKLLSDDGEYRVIQDRHGYTVKKIIGKSRTVECLDHVTTDRQTWENLKHRFQFNPKDKSRVDDKSYFLHMDEYPTWEQAKAKYDRLRQKNKYLAFNAYGPWEGTWRHRGYQDLLMDVAMDPDWVHDMGSAQTGLLIDILKHSIKLDMKPDSIFMVDDLGSTKALLFSPDSWRAIFKPIYKKLGEFLHDNGISFWLHCCGSCEPLFEDLIESGLDVIQPLQAHAGLDVRLLKPKYGDRLTFWGNIDARKMSGPAEDLEAEIRDKITIAKQGGGYMYHSDHSIPPEVSFDRYKWIMELVRKYGAYD